MTLVVPLLETESSFECLFGWKLTTLGCLMKFLHMLLEVKIIPLITIIAGTKILRFKSLS